MIEIVKVEPLINDRIYKKDGKFYLERNHEDLTDYPTLTSVNKKKL